jgi:putative flippase GtrA
MTETIRSPLPTAPAQDGTGPDVTDPDVTGPEVTGPEVTGPDVTGPDVTGPGGAGPDVTGHSVTGPGGTGHPVVEIVIPVYNEESDLQTSVRRLRTYLDTSFPFSALVTIADNASTDMTWEIASDLARTVPGVAAIHLDQKGRGRALRTAWLASGADVVAYMDVDLSTDLDALLPLVAPLLSGHSHLAIGSRLARGAYVVRSPKREVISRSYNLILRTVLGNRFSDAQCGFKAIRRDTAGLLLPFVDDQEWFFDTELLIEAERRGLRIHEVPVDWVDDPDSTVHIARTARDDLLGVWRMVHRRPKADEGGHPELRRHPVKVQHAGELSRYASVGIVSTVLYLALYLLLLKSTGTYGANALAFALCTVGNTFAHARYTFGSRTPGGLRHAAAVGLGGLIIGVGFTSLALVVAQALGQESATAKVAAIIVGTAVAGLVRFVLFQAWAFRSYTRAVARADLAKVDVAAVLAAHTAGDPDLIRASGRAVGPDN